MSRTVIQKKEQKVELSAPEKREREDEFAAAKRIAKERNLDQSLTRLFARDDLSVEDKIITLVMDALKPLSLIRGTFRDEDLITLEGYEFGGTKRTIEEVFNLLEAAVDLHCATT